MRAAVIGASSESIHAINTARNSGIKVLALDGNPEAEGLKAADEAMVVNISNLQQTIDILAKQKPDFVLPVPIGRYLITTGAVNDAFGLPGLTKDAADICTDKYRFHTVLSQENLRPCHCYLIQTKDLQNLAGGKWSGELSYPAILKPRYGSGSRAIFFLNESADLRKAAEKILKEAEGTVKDLKEAKEAEGTVKDLKEAEKAVVTEDFVLEEAALGEEYGVDGAMDGDVMKLVLLRKKLLTAPPARQAVGYLSVVPTEQLVLFEAVRKYLEQDTKAMRLKDCLFHADLMIDGNNVFLIELSARPSGHNLHNLFTPLATGVDTAGNYIQKMAGLPYTYDVRNTRHMLIRYFDLENCTVNKVPDPEKLNLDKGVKIVKWKCNIQPGDWMQPVSDGHSIMGRGYFILEGNDDKSLLKAADEVLDQFQ